MLVKIRFARIMEVALGLHLLTTVLGSLWQLLVHNYKRSSVTPEGFERFFAHLCMLSAFVCLLFEGRLWDTWDALTGLFWASGPTSL